MEQKKLVVDNSALYFQNSRRYFLTKGFDQKKLEFLRDAAKDLKQFETKHPIIERIVENHAETPYYGILLAESDRGKTEKLSNALTYAYGQGADLSALLPAFELFLKDKAHVATLTENEALEFSGYNVSKIYDRQTQMRWLIPAPEEIKIDQFDGPNKSYVVERTEGGLFNIYSFNYRKMADIIHLMHEMIEMAFSKYRKEGTNQQPEPVELFALLKKPYDYFCGMTRSHLEKSGRTAYKALTNVLGREASIIQKEYGYTLPKWMNEWVMRQLYSD